MQGPIRCNRVSLYAPHIYTRGQFHQTFFAKQKVVSSQIIRNHENSKFQV
jgi:hypothetical protein